VTPEQVGIGAIAFAIVGILSLFVRSLVRRQDSIMDSANERQDAMFVWFTERLNGSLDALKDALSNNREAMSATRDAMEHNTKNLKALQELSAKMLEAIIHKDAATAKAIIEKIEAKENQVMAKIDELLARDRSQTRERSS
jgi:predicted transcriptional regulator